METGVPGQLGALAARLVEVEHKLEHVCATTQHLPMVELLVWEAHLNHKLAMPKTAQQLQVWLLSIIWIFKILQDIQKQVRCKLQNNKINVLSLEFFICSFVFTLHKIKKTCMLYYLKRMHWSKWVPNWPKEGSKQTIAYHKKL